MVNILIIKKSMGLLCIYQKELSAKIVHLVCICDYRKKSHIFGLEGFFFDLALLLRHQVLFFIA